MEHRALGSQGLTVSAVGLGCMGMSGMYGPIDPAGEAESIATIHRALDLGITLLDTGDFYGMGHNEMLIGRALRGRREQAILSVKFGALRAHDGAFLGFDGRPAFVKTSLAYSLQRLGVDYIDFYFPSRVDPQVPIEDTMGAVADLIREGKVRYAGVSEASAESIRRAHAVQPLTALQIEYSLWSRDIEDQVLPTVRELGIGVLAYGVFSRGLITGAPGAAGPFDPRDIRRHFPRFVGGNLAANLKLVDALKAIAERRGATVPQLALAWVLARGRDIVPLIGTRRRTYLDENLGGLALKLSAADLEEIERAVPRGAAAGGRYPQPAMASLNR